MLSIDKIRKMSGAGKEEREKELEKKKDESLKKQRFIDLKEAKEKIREAEKRITLVTKKGEKRSVDVCVLRRGIHFSKEFDGSQSPAFLGLIGKKIYDHFSTKGFKVSFKEWEDGMRMREFESDCGYQVVVSW